MKWFYNLCILIICFFIGGGPAFADMGPRRVLLMGGSASSILPPPLVPNQPDIFFDFTKNVALQKTSGISTATSLLTTTRASSGYVNDSSGNWKLIPANTPRISNLGLLLEEGRTNSIRNNSMQGAVVMADNIERTTNGNFAAQGTGWGVNTTSGTSAVVFSTGQVSITGDGSTTNTWITQQITGLTVGRNYVLSLAGSSGTLIINVGTTGANSSDLVSNVSVSPNGINSTNPDRVGFTATQTQATITVKRSVATAAILTAVSVQDGERAQNVGFPFSPINASQATIQNGWQWTFAGGTTTVTYTGGNSVTITPDGTNAGKLLSAAIPTVSGFNYNLTYDDTGNAVSVSVGTTSGATDLFNNTSLVGTHLQIKFKATSSTSFVTFSRTSTGAAVIGNVSVQSAGALPTNWTINNAGPGGLLTNVLALNTIQGINTMDLQITGTYSGSPSWQLVPEPANLLQITTPYGNTWAQSIFWQTLQSDPNVTGMNLETWTYQSNGTTFLGTNSATILPVSVGPLTRQGGAQTFTNSLTGIIQPMIRISNALTSGTMDYRLRIGWPQLENAGGFLGVGTASAVAVSSGSGGVNGTAVYQVSGGTVNTSATTLNVTWTSGVLTVNSVASAGGYTGNNGYPSSPATLTYVSGTATGWTGATVTLTPQNVGGGVTYSSPIPTTGAAATRSADLIQRNFTAGSSYSMWAQGTPLEPTAGGALQSMFSVAVDSSNRTAMRRQSGNGQPSVSGTGGTGYSISSPTVHAQGTDGKYAAAAAAGDQAFSFAGDIHTSAVATLPNTPTFMAWGPNAGTSSFYWNGFVEKSAVWYSQRVPNTFLQSITK